jgi:dihydrolipoamide dehydrogenase
MIEQTYDVVVIGAGAAGENVADRVAQAGLSVVVVESDLVGGECSYWACMPSKVLLRAGAALRAARAVPGAREALTGDLDRPAVLRHRDEIASGWRDDGQVEWLKHAGIDLIRGHGRLAGIRQVKVTPVDGPERLLRARHAVALTTGSSASIPPIPGLAQAGAWTSREVTSAPAVPNRLAIIGGGVVACEMATAYSDLGSRVSLLVRDGLLAASEPFAGELVAAALADRGVDVRQKVEVTAVQRVETKDGESSTVLIDLSDGSRLETDEILAAVGRVPNTTDLGLETVGLVPGEWLSTDETLVVRRPGAGAGAAQEAEDEPWLYAVGDLNQRALLTHQGKYQARAAGDAIAARAHREPLHDGPWGRHAATTDHAGVPQVTFTDPEVASVGLTAARAEALGRPVAVIDYDLGAVAGAVVHAAGYTGRARIVIDEQNQVLIGATFVGPDVAELLQAATIAIVGEVPIHRLWHAVPAYPTISEVWLRLLEQYGRNHA